MELPEKITKGHIPALDGIRGLAILLVLMTHLSERFVFGGPILNFIKNIAFAGWTGVDLFFVLSGFLITGILWDSKQMPHYFLNFYARRTVRIFPLYYATLLIIFVVVPAMSPIFVNFPPRIWHIVQDQVSGIHASSSYWPCYFGYLVDFLEGWKGSPVYAGHFWTLAVEEHFYLLWPLLVYRLEYRTLIWTSLVLVVVTLIIRATLLPFINPFAVYVLTPCRMDGLALGAFLALAIRSPGGWDKLFRVARLLLPVSAFLWVGLMFYLHGWWQYGRLSQTLGYTITIFFYGSLLVMALSVKRIASCFSGRTLRFFGKYSYAIYVFHIFPLFCFIPLFALGQYSRYSVVLRFFPGVSSGAEKWLLLRLDGLLYVVAVVGASVLMALISWHLLEKPALRLKRFFPMKNKALQIACALPIPAKQADLV